MHTTIAVCRANNVITVSLVCHDGKVCFSFGIMGVVLQLTAFARRGQPGATLTLWQAYLRSSNSLAWNGVPSANHSFGPKLWSQSRRLRGSGYSVRGKSKSKGPPASGRKQVDIHPIEHCGGRFYRGPPYLLKQHPVLIPYEMEA